MEQTFLQQRIEERAKNRLKKDLVEATEKEMEVASRFGQELFKPQLDARWHYSSYDSHKEIRFYNDKTKELFDQMLPRYVQMITDEILQQIDQIDYLLQSKEYAEAE